ncbi:MAG: hypothetical protein ABI608_01125 [Rhizomicrobium sp.]
MHVLNDMRCFGTLTLAFVALTAGPGAAWAFRIPEGNAAWPTEHQRLLRVAETQTQPYAMSYTDEAARTLGVREGQWEAFSPRSGDMPSLKGGLSGGRPMLILQWRPGQ